MYVKKYTVRQICSRTRATSQQPGAISVRSNMHFKGWTFPYHLSKFHSFWLIYNEDMTVHVKQDFGRGRNFNICLWWIFWLPFRTLTLSESYWKHHVSSPVTIDFRKFGLFSAAATTSLEWLIFIDSHWSFLNVYGTNFAQTFVLPKSSCIRFTTLLPPFSYRWL